MATGGEFMSLGSAGCKYTGRLSGYCGHYYETPEGTHHCRKYGELRLHERMKEPVRSPKCAEEAGRDIQSRLALARIKGKK